MSPEQKAAANLRAKKWRLNNKAKFSAIVAKSTKKRRSTPEGRKALNAKSKPFIDAWKEKNRAAINEGQRTYYARMKATDPEKYKLTLERARARWAARKVKTGG